MQAAVLGIARLAGIEPFPVPPFSAMRRTTSRWLFHYYHSGLTTYLPIATVALREGIDLRSPVRVLDFGVGAARQLLHFTRHFPRPEYHACDVDPELAAFVGRAYPNVQVRANLFEPPLEYPDGHFDMVYGVSVFSHLAPAAHLPWLRELHRVTRSGGSCFLTTEGWAALPRVARTIGAGNDALAQELNRAGLVFRPYERFSRTQRGKQSPSVGISGPYGSTLLSSTHVRLVWPESGFQVAAILEGIINHRQDLIVLHKP